MAERALPHAPAMTISAILLSGGVGSRMDTSTPKQYLPLSGKLIAQHACKLLQHSDQIDELIVVCHENYRGCFPDCLFASPGTRRQDSLYNGLKLVNAHSEFVLVHDAARPLLLEEDLNALISAGREYGAATLATAVTSTIKQADSSLLVQRTLERDSLFSIQTPQMIRKDVLTLGFALANQKGLTVTDDVSLAELTGHPVKLVMGSSENIKITTPEDLAIAESLLDERLLQV